MNTSTKPLHDPELGEYDLRVVVVFQGHRGGTPVIDRIRATIIIPMALHPTFHEEAMLQLKGFLENGFRTAQIALNDYLDKHGPPPTTPDGKVAVDMEVRLPSVATSPSPSAAQPSFIIKPTAPATEVK
jgi:hypothetical protein